MHFLFVCHEVAFEGKCFVANITDFVFDTVMDAEHMSFQVFWQDERLGALETLVFSDSFMGLCNVTVEVPLIGNPPVAFWALDPFPVDAGTMSLQACHRAIRVWALVALEVFDIVVLVRFVRLQLIQCKERLVTLVAKVASDLFMKRQDVTFELVCRLEGLWTLVTDKVVRARVYRLNVTCEPVLFNKC